MTRVRFGDIVLDRGAMLVTRSGERVEIEPKAYDVLLHLVDRPGQLVTKGELIASVWKGVAVTDHVLTRIVAQLRRALGDAAREAKYIETVPTRGYRFIARIDPPIESAATPTTSSEPMEAALRAAPSGSRAWMTRRRSVLLVAALSVVVLAVGAWVVVRGSSARVRWAAAPERARQLTFEPALDVYPNFSRDGHFLAYASSASGAFELEVRSMAPDARAQRVTSDRGGNIQPDWSPDGQYLVYHSIVAGGIWVVPAFGGVPRRVVSVGSSPAWSPDGRAIAFQSGEPATAESGGTPPPSRLWLVDADGSRPRSLTRPGHPAGGHTEPAWSPDGRRLAFIARSVARAEIWSVEAAGGEPHLLWSCSVDCSRVSYQPDGLAIVYSVGGQGYMRLEVDPVTGESKGSPTLLLPQRSDSVGQIAISPDGRSAVFTNVRTRSGLYSLMLDRQGHPQGAPTVVTNAIGRAMTPSFSPDGERVAFIARRESVQICLVAPTGGELTPLPVPTGFDATFRPAWSPRGEILGMGIGDRGAAVVAIDPASRESRIVRSLGPSSVGANTRFLAPSFFADGRRMAFAREDGDSVGIWTMDLASQQATKLTPPGVNATFPTPSPDGQFIVYERIDDTGMHAVVIPAGGGPARELTSGRGLTWPHSWSADGTRVFVAMRRGAVWSIGSIAAASGEVTTLTTLETPHGYVRYPSVSPDGSRVVYEQTEITGNLWQVPLWADAAAGTR